MLPAKRESVLSALHVSLGDVRSVRGKNASQPRQNFRRGAAGFNFGGWARRRKAARALRAAEDFRQPLFFENGDEGFAARTRGFGLAVVAAGAACEACAH